MNDAQSPCGKLTWPAAGRTSWAWFSASWLGMALLLVSAEGACGAGAPASLTELETQAIKAAVARVAPSVVRIETFGGMERVGRLLVGPGATTGLIVSPDGYVISSMFPFVQQPATILVRLPNGRRAVARIAARDHNRMLVLLKVNTDEPLPAPEPAPRSELRAGQWAIALGRTFEADEPSVWVGVISATNRIWGKAVQTDARISPRNYGGPLIDIRGRVIGVLVPLSPESDNAVAGVQWYDSGIGFAIPLEDILARLDGMKQGQDVRPGLLGVTLKGDDPYADPAVVAAVHPKSPAAEAGVRPGDVIVEAAGRPVERQLQLRHALEPLDAGQQVALTLMRGERRIEVAARLAAALEPYEHPLLGVLPVRPPDAPQQGVAVRDVFPESGAAQIGLKPGDVILQLDGRPIADAGAVRLALAAKEPGQTVRVAWRRDGQSREAEAKLGRFAVDPPQRLPAAHRPPKPSDAPRPPTGVVEVNVPDEPNECYAYVPPDYHPDVAYGLLVWIAPPGDFDPDDLASPWKQLCRQYDLIYLSPKSTDPIRWHATEAGFVRKAIEQAAKAYRVDRTRVVVGGRQASGVMGALVALQHREAVRGLALIDGPLPSGVRPPDNDPVQRLAVFAAWAANAPWAERVEQSVQLLKDMKYPVTTRSLGPTSRELKADERAELARWIDTLDRL